MSPANIIDAPKNPAMAVLESITDAFIALDNEWRITYANAEAERLNGMRRADMIGRNHWDLCPDAVGTTVHAEFLRAAAEGVPVEFENYYAPSRRWFHVKAFPAEGGGLSVFFADVTARRAVEEEHAALLRREREAREEAETLNEVSRAMAGELDLDKLVRAMTEAAVKATRARSGRFVPAGGEGGTKEPLDPTQRAVPVAGRRGEVLGHLHLIHPERGAFTEREERLARAIATCAGMAIDNARLFQQAEREIEPRKRTEGLLLENEQRFRAMIDALPAAIYTTDAEGRLTHYNPAAVELSGRVPELGSDKWCVTWKLYMPDGTPLEHKDCPMAVALKGGHVTAGAECIAERPDGSRVWFTPYPTPLLDHGGQVSGGINMLLDITGRKTAEEALRRSDERFRSLFESSSAGVAMASLAGQFLQANRAFCDITGYSESELRGLNCAAITHPDDRAAIEELTGALSTGQIPACILETRYQTKDGRSTWAKNSISAVRDAQGRPEYLIALCEDVSGRKRAEDALRESEERFRAIFETTPECVKVVARDGTLLHINPPGLAMVGATCDEEAIGKCVYDLISPEFRAAFREFNERICSGEKGSLEFDFTGLSGHRRHMETHAAPMRDRDGSLVQLAITRDITDRKRRETAALLLGAIVDSSDDAIVSKDLNGIVTSWNKGAERLFGYEAEEVIGKSITIVIPPDRLDEEPAILTRLRRGERVDHFETVRRRKDGTKLDISLTISPVKDEDGHVIGASKIARNISDRKLAERAIQDLNARLTAELSAMTRMQQLSTRLVQADAFSPLLDEIVDAGMEITGADMGIIQLLEDGALTIVAQRGFDSPFLEFFRHVRGPESACGTALLEGERVVVEDVRTSPVFSNAARAAMLEAGARAVQATPLLTRSGQVLGMFSTHYHTPSRPGERELRLLDVLARQAADLIERQRTNTALLASEARLRQLADSMPQIVWTARPDGYLDYFNERWYEFTGFARDKFGDEVWDAAHPEEIERCHRAWYRCVKSGEPFRIECRFRDRHENRWRWFMGRALAYRDASGAIVKWFGTFTDIDEQKRVEDELRRANQDLEQFAYSASHDLQEPLRSINIYSELLAQRHGAKLEGQALEFLQYLRAGASRMEMLVRDLLAYTQISRLEPPKDATDANEAVAGTVEGLSGAVAESGAAVTFDRLPSIRMHAAHLSQLLQNLIGNAIKYRSRERAPSIHVGCERENGYWVFSVADNGIGIEPQYKEHIFGLFKRLHTVDQYSGTGIGLAICQRIVERYHGRIWVESEPGRGSTFFFKLPI